jgi:hypothetical protein
LQFVPVVEPHDGLALPWQYVPPQVFAFMFALYVPIAPPTSAKSTSSTLFRCLLVLVMLVLLFVVALWQNEQP